MKKEYNVITPEGKEKVSIEGNIIDNDSGVIFNDSNYKPELKSRKYVINYYVDYVAKEKGLLHLFSKVIKRKHYFSLMVSDDPKDEQFRLALSTFEYQHYINLVKKEFKEYAESYLGLSNVIVTSVVPSGEYYIVETSKGKFATLKNPSVNPGIPSSNNKEK